MAVHGYSVERLYDDQSPDFVIDAVPALLTWLGGAEAPRSPRRFAVEVGRGSERDVLTITWDLGQLSERDPALVDRVRRLRGGPHREHVTEVAAYGLALVAISVFLPGRRVVAWSKYVAPDLLFDAAPNARRGVEVAGRTKGGWAALRTVRDGSRKQPGKAGQLRDDPEIAEAWLSLWCGAPAVAMMVKIKP